MLTVYFLVKTIWVWLYVATGVTLHTSLVKVYRAQQVILYDSRRRTLIINGSVNGGRCTDKTVACLLLSETGLGTGGC